MVNTPLSRFKTIAKLEGISFLLLLGIAMPLKYFADMPMAVKYAGWLHGVLFIAYIYLLFFAAAALKWNFKKTALIFLASLVPFAPFYVDKKI